jgi:hypothetical protein
MCGGHTYRENKQAMFQWLSTQTGEPPERNMPAILQNLYYSDIVRKKYMTFFDSIDASVKSRCQVSY